MSRALLATVFLLLSGLLVAQYNYKIPASEKVKTGHGIFPANFFTEEIPWGDIESECLTETVKYGKWLSLAPKSAQATFEVVSGKNGKTTFGTLKAPTIYVGEVVSDGRGQKIQELKCRQFEKSDDDRYSISLKDLDKKGEYFILVTSNEPGASFAIQVTDEYFPDVVQTPAEPIVTSTDQSISGRITSAATGLGVGAHKVELLDEEMQLIRSVLTDQDGGFEFEKLPRDQVYLTRIEEDDPDLMVEMYLIDSDGYPVQRGSKVGDRVYGFPSLGGEFVQLVLLSDEDWQLKTEPGMVGIMGRIVDGKSMLTGYGDIRVGLYDHSKNEIGFTVTDGSGRFHFDNKNPDDYMIRYENAPEESYSEMVIVDDHDVPYLFANSRMEDEEGYFSFEKLPIDIVELKRMEVEDTEMELPTDFTKMEEGSPIVLRNILFGSGSFELLPSSYKELDQLVSALNENPSANIEISGHTDNTGDPNTNLLLSENRAKAVMNYLTSKGINKERLTAKGFGSKRPLASNNTEEGKSQNRRVEFVVIE